jgi:hypothetical protein
VTIISIILQIAVAFGLIHAHFNWYQYKKTICEGVLDVALLSANLNQLFNLVHSGGDRSLYYLNLIVKIISIILQIAVAFGLIHAHYNGQGENRRNADRIDKLTVCGILLILIINVFISVVSILNVISYVKTLKELSSASNLGK